MQRPAVSRPGAAASAAAPPPRRLVAAAALAPQQRAATGTPRRAADVAVLGNSLQAYAAAYLLAKRGQRVVLVEHAVPALAPPPGARTRRPDVLLHLPATTPHLVDAASEALGLWRGIEAASERRDLLQLCGSADVAPARGSSEASEALGRMQDACAAAGLQFAMLAPDQVSAAFPRLRPPSGTATLYTPAGGVVQGQVAAAVLRAMAQRAGADVASGGTGGSGERCLLGWRDAGSHFALRTGTADSAAAGVAAGARAAAAAAGSEGETIYEAEQLVLLPEAGVQRQALALFGLRLPGAALWGVPAASWAAQEECAGVPLWQLLGSGSTRPVDDPTAIDACWGAPLLSWSPGGVLVGQSLADGVPLEPPPEPPADAADAGSGGTSAAEAAAARAAAAAAAAASSAGDAAAVAAAAAAVAEVALEERPDSEEAIDAQLQRLKAEQQQAAAAERRLDTAGSLATRLVYGVGGRLAGSASQLRCIVTADGESAAGSHPGYEAGRLVVAFPAAGRQRGCLPADQLAPLVARLALAALQGSAPEAVDAAAVALGRQALGAEAAELRHDTWAELGRAP